MTTIDATELAPLPPEPDDSIDTPAHLLDAYEAQRAGQPTVDLAVGAVVWATVDRIGHGLIHTAEDAADVFVRLSTRRPLRKVRLVVVEVEA